MIRTLGQGGQGRALLIRTRDTRKLNAVTKLYGDPDQARRELQILELIGSNPNVIDLLEFFEGKPDPRGITVVLEYCAGGDLMHFKERALAAQTAVTEDFIWVAGVSIVSALAFLHSGYHMDRLTPKHLYERNYSIVHGDLKPENVLLVRDSEHSAMKICDFGFRNELSMGKRVGRRAGPQYGNQRSKLGVRRL